VNTVNCVGVMGRGVALQFRNAYPENFKVYKAACDRKELHPGRVLTFDRASFENPRFLINFPTKVHWKGKSRMEYIDSGLEALVEEVRRREIRSIALPPLGCGLGGLDWDEVRPRIEAAFAELPSVRVLLYEPAGAPAPETMTHAAAPPKMTLGNAAPLALVQRYLAALMDTSVTLLEIQKLLYFLQESGEPLNLKYAKGHYGPYSETVRHVLKGIEGHYLLGYGDAADVPTREIKLVEDYGEKAEKFLQDHQETLPRLKRVSDLICGFETAYGMELLATVHWVVTKEGARNLDDVINRVYKWSDRKRMFPEVHLQIAYEVLKEKGWFPREDYNTDGNNFVSQTSFDSTYRPAGK